jgi:hypothetical protein
MQGIGWYGTVKSLPATLPLGSERGAGTGKKASRNLLLRLAFRKSGRLDSNQRPPETYSGSLEGGFLGKCGPFGLVQTRAGITAGTDEPGERLEETYCQTVGAHCPGSSSIVPAPETPWPHGHHAGYAATSATAHGAWGQHIGGQVSWPLYPLLATIGHTNSFGSSPGEVRTERSLAPFLVRPGVTHD